MEYKWFCIMVAVAAIAGFSGMAVDRYSVSQCKVSYISSNKTADEILQICGK